ncbi:MAG: S9 family peptidase [Alphaproteobacteria bacterium]|nr:S9 family peptidase [Alphaproteobacteria bacterium]
MTLGAACAASQPAAEPEATPVSTAPTPPPTPRDEGHVVTFHGVDVPDPYHALEDLDAPDTQAWVVAQRDHARAWLDALPSRPALRDRLAALWRHARWGTPERRGGLLFHAYNDGTQDQAVLMVRQSADDPGRVLVDPNPWSEDGTVALGGWSVSDDGRWLAYAIAEAGSDWRTWKVRDVRTGEDLPDELLWVKFSNATWLPDGSGFFYNRYPEPSQTGDATFADLANQAVWFHRRGTPQTDDVLIHEDPEHPQWGFDASVPEGGEHLVLYVGQGTEEKNRVWTWRLADLPLDRPGARTTVPPTKVLDDFDASYLLVSLVDGRLLLRTDQGAPRGRLIAVDLAHPERAAWRELVAEQPDALRSATRVGDHLVLSYLHDATSLLHVHALDGRLEHTVALPGLGTAGFVSGHAGDPEGFLSFEGFTTPDTVLALDPATGATATVFTPEVPADLGPWVTEQVFVPGKDGTRVPVFLVHHKDLDRSRPHPTLLYGYGGFDIPITPAFRVMTLAWLEQGGVYASANLRGGGEYGRAWHDAGTKTSKQNVFDDLIASAEWLVDQGWTTPAQLGVHGRSNGGLLVGAVLTQRPDLFGAAVPSVGVLDMLQYHRWTIGWAWASDYGTAEESEEMFRYLLRYSPVHNTRPGVRYPPTLVTTGDHDDRVVPGHSYKFAAALQHDQGGDAPILLRVETRAGHGAGTPVSLLVDEQADVLAFLWESLGGSTSP